MSEPIVVVINTSVLISGLIGKGTSKRILDMIEECILIPAVSKTIISEYRKALSYPKIAEKINIANMRRYLNFIEAKHLIYTDEIIHRVCRDPKDDIYLNVAYQAKATAILTWDTDILDLRDNKNGIQLDDTYTLILTPKEFIDTISTKPSNNTI